MFYTEKERETPINDTYDVIVVGSGPAGISAAVAAGRCGVKVLLLEMLGSVGGISTSGLMSHWTGRCGNKLYHEFLDRAEKKAVFRTEWRETIDPEMLRNVYYEMLKDAGVDILLYTIVCDVIMDGDKVVGVIGQSKSGRVAYMASSMPAATATLPAARVRHTPSAETVTIKCSPPPSCSRSAALI